MKKCQAIVLLIQMFAASAFAESVDLDAMSTDELLALRSQINAILTERMTSDSSAIYSGNYVVGVDIKAGMYILRFDELAEGETTGIVWLFANSEDWRNRKYISADYLTVGVDYQITLEDNMVLEITKANGSIRSIVKPDWAP